MICQVCGTTNELDREFCAKCQSKLLVVSGASETYDESTSEEAVSLDEHLLERVSVLEEVVKRSAETLRMLLDAAKRQERNGFVGLPKAPSQRPRWDLRAPLTNKRAGRLRPFMKKS